MTRFSRAITSAVFAAGVLSGADATAATFTVDPTQIFLSGRSNSALVRLRNDSAEPLRFQLSVFAWSQSRTGELQVDPTKDIVFFPSLLTLQPGEERRIRVASSAPVGPTEKTYRIFVEELPPLDRSTAAGGSIRVLTKMGIPIFLRPAKEASTAALADLSVVGGHATFALVNAGTIHFVPKSVRVVGRTAAGDAFEGRAEAWYVLAGSRREFDIELPESQCGQITSILVDVLVSDSSLQQVLQTPAGVCR